MVNTFSTKKTKNLAKFQNDKYNAIIKETLQPPPDTSVLNDFGISPEEIMEMQEELKATALLFESACYNEPDVEGGIGASAEINHIGEYHG